MNKEIIKAPKGIKYISEWTDYELPLGHCIVDKGVTGCGYTEYCLTSPDNIILCSPRKLLLENKAEQHQEDRNILYLKNDVTNFEGVKNLEFQITKHILECESFSSPRKAVKFLVTYDSAHYVIDYLQKQGSLDKYYVVVDEFQSIFLDSFFKSEVEFDFVQNLQCCPNVLYLSATPMLDKYLEKVPEFKDLDFYEIDWSETGIVENVVIKRKFAKSLVSSGREIVQKYKEGKFPFEFIKGRGVIESKEAVLFYNALGEIIEIIKKEFLTPENVNIICADTPENKTKLQRLTKDLKAEIKRINLSEENKIPEFNGEFTIGRIPLRGEKNPMFTFCTKTAYIGADFYSDNASTFVFADPNIKSLALDISLDLPQIVGRQRDRENPFKNVVTVFYRTIRKKEMEDREAFDEKQKQRKKESENLLSFYVKGTPEEQAAFVKKLRDGIKVSQYSDDFVSISKRTGLPIYNSFLEIANERAWDVSQKDYQDKISVTRALEEVATELGEYKNEIETIVSDFLDHEFYKTGIFHLKMEAYCKFMDKHRRDFNQELQDMIYFKIKDDRFRKYYNYYGTSGCRAKKFRENELYAGMIDVSKDLELKLALRKHFEVGKSYSKKDIKFILSNLYRDLGISRNPKATDLGEYYVMARSKLTIDGKEYSGFRLKDFIGA